MSVENSLWLTWRFSAAEMERKTKGSVSVNRCFLSNLKQRGQWQIINISVSDRKERTVPSVLNARSVLTYHNSYTQWCKFMSKNLNFAGEISRGGRGRTRVGGAIKKREISLTS